jgi:hypothetical protein
MRHTDCIANKEQYIIANNPDLQISPWIARLIVKFGFARMNSGNILDGEFYSEELDLHLGIENQIIGAQKFSDVCVYHGNMIMPIFEQIIVPDGSRYVYKIRDEVYTLFEERKNWKTRMLAENAALSALEKT